MKNVVWIENADRPAAEGFRMIRRIREELEPEILTVISEGDFLSNGKPAGSSAADRACKWKEAGADLVLKLPVSSILSGYGKKDFAVAALMQKLHSVERVILPCHPFPGQTAEACGELLRKCAMLIFRENPDYRKQMQENLRQRKSFLQSQMEAIIYCVPEAANLLRFAPNRQSISILDAMLQLYYIVKVDFYPSETDAPSLHPETDEHRLLAFDRQAAERLRELLKDRPREYLMNISGSTEKSVDRILELSQEIGQTNSFREIVDLVETVFPNKDMARLFLLRALLNIRNSDMLISGLHTYVPYSLLLEENETKPEEIRLIEETSWVPFLRTGGGQNRQIDDALRILLAMDEKTEDLFL